MILYLTEPGSKLRLVAEQLQVEKGRQILERIPRHSVEEIVLLGGTQVTSQAMRGLIEQGTPLHLLTHYGRYIGHLEPALSGKADVLRVQVRCLDHPDACLRFARAVIRAKVQNSRCVVLRLARTRPRSGYSAAASDQMAGIIETIATATRIEQLRGLEGNAARVYFSAVRTFIDPTWGFNGRRYRPPRDPVNSLLSLGYSLALSKVMSTLQLVGLHPAIGFLHTGHGRRPALALDLLEEYRAVLVDRLVLKVISRRIISLSDFTRDSKGVRLTGPATKRFLGLFAKRLDDSVTLPDGTTSSYGELFLRQAKSFLNALRDETEPYRPVRFK